MGEAIIAREYLEQGGWITALQEKAIETTDETKAIVADFQETEEKIQELNRKKSFPPTMIKNDFKYSMWINISDETRNEATTNTNKSQEEIDEEIGQVQKEMDTIGKNLIFRSTEPSTQRDEFFKKRNELWNKHWLLKEQRSMINKNQIINTNNTEKINDDIEKESKNLKNSIRTKNSEIINKDIEIKLNGKTIDEFKTISAVLNSNKSLQEKIQIIVESIHWTKNNRIDTEDKKNTPFYCGDRALLLNQIFEENKEKLSIEENNLALPYWHVINVIKMDNKVYIANSGSWCFNEITENLKIENKWKREIIKLKEPIRLYKDSNKLYSLTTFPTTKNLWNDQFLYIAANLMVVEHYNTKQLYEKARSTIWYENTESIEDLEKFLDDILYKKEKPYEWILAEWDVLLTFPKDDQIKMIKWQINNRLSYKENENKLNSFENISKENSKNYDEYNIKNKDNFLAEFRGEDMDISTAINLSNEDKNKIFEILPNMITDEKWDTPQNKMINKLINSMNTDKSILWKDNEKLDTKLKKYLKALNLRATQANSTIEEELTAAFQAEENKRVNKIQNQKRELSEEEMAIVQRAKSADKLKSVWVPKMESNEKYSQYSSKWRKIHIQYSKNNTWRVVKDLMQNDLYFKIDKNAIWTWHDWNHDWATIYIWSAKDAIEIAKNIKKNLWDILETWNTYTKTAYWEKFYAWSSTDIPLWEWIAIRFDIQKTDKYLNEKKYSDYAIPSFWGKKHTGIPTLSKHSKEVIELSDLLLEGNITNEEYEKYENRIKEIYEESKKELEKDFGKDFLGLDEIINFEK